MGSFKLATVRLSGCLYMKVLLIALVQTIQVTGKCIKCATFIECQTDAFSLLLTARLDMHLSTAKQNKCSNFDNKPVGDQFLFQHSEFSCQSKWCSFGIL